MNLIMEEIKSYIQYRVNPSINGSLKFFVNGHRSIIVYYIEHFSLNTLMVLSGASA